MADNALTKLPLAGQLGVAALVAAIICGGFYWFYYSDALEQQTKKEAQLAKLQQEIRALEATANRLPEFQREVQALEARLETLKRILPPEKEMPDLMRRVQYLAAQSSLAVRKFNPTATAQKEFYLEVPITLDLEGTYHNLGAFFDRVSRMSRLVNLGNIKIQAQKSPDHQQHDRHLGGGHDLRVQGAAAGTSAGPGGEEEPAMRTSPMTLLLLVLAALALVAPVQAQDPGAATAAAEAPGVRPRPPRRTPRPGTSTSTVRPSTRRSTGAATPTTPRAGVIPSSACSARWPPTAAPRRASRGWKAS